MTMQAGTGPREAGGSPAAHESRERVDAAAALLGASARRDLSFGAMTTYRVGGPAALTTVVGSEVELSRVASVAASTQIDVLVVGLGSNLLVADAGFAGLVIVLGECFAEVTVDGAVVRAGGGARLPVVARRTAAAGLTGFEWAVGVPGSIGGAVRMNAGGHGSDMARSLIRVRLVDVARGVDATVAAADLDLSYRHSNVSPSSVVVWAELSMRAGDRQAAEAEIAEIVRWRRANQPGGQNAGSVFANPAGDSAGRLIEAAGGKGLRIGTASVSTKHANFIQADEGGSADDVLALMVELRRRVADHAGVVLRPETHLLGFGPLPELSD